jgi:hypothetical protein
MLFVFDTKTKLYRYTDGRGTVPKRVIEGMKSRIRKKAAREVLGLRQRYDQDGIRLIELLSEVEDILSYATIALAGISSGGLRSNPVIDNYVLAHVESQRQYLTDLFIQVENGSVSNKQFKARLNRYLQDIDQGEAIANHALEIQNGKNYAFRILGDTEHCPSCERYFAMGVAASNLLPPPKIACECTSRCKCTIFYFETLEEALKRKNVN